MSSKLKINTRVRSLKNYLEEFEQGAFQIPSFQRDFLWNPDDIKQLFDSIKNNYPIGSILFWKPLEGSQAWSPKYSKIGPYTIQNSKSNEIVFILDGYQRLSSLFGCLTNPQKYNKTLLELNENEWSKKFNLFYDLDEEQFIYIRNNLRPMAYQVPVYVFMNSIDFRQYARRNFEQYDINEDKLELYYDRADRLGQIFNSYDIASVDINYANIEEAVEIFWRINEKGLTISKDWIASALTNTSSFRLGTKIDDLLERLEKYNFQTIKRDIIFQCIQSSFGKIYFDYKIEDLVKRKDFAEITGVTLSSIERAVQFLYEDLLVLNNRLLPYNTQLIFLTVFFNSLGVHKPTEKQIISLKKWFWITSYSNYFTIYSLSNQRKAFESFCSFTRDEDVDPVYYDNGNIKFSTADFPSKISMGSVRSKSLALFMINHSVGIKNISPKSLPKDKIEKFEFGSLYPITQRENPTENIIPVIKFSNNENSLKIKQKNNNLHLLNEENPDIFIDYTVVRLNKEKSRHIEVLIARKYLIMIAEKDFVEALGLIYNSSDLLDLNENY
ncbi:DUF262 domain-containing protein [Elizabethkingia sp. HX XZB]|uniref:DUF262 domain-containing protein n=1 Tax=Elizabethkingia sp. HX XZB TaxID=3003193 RepID=UPI002A24207F|nr:DUF262 domain-containing protein [Elizabethkingia sp. HX XZB]MDX8568141.1 DUF262 domain-containing protein [Elizabethkingia sp. HX XZB]